MSNLTPDGYCTRCSNAPLYYPEDTSKMAQDEWEFCAPCIAYKSMSDETDLIRSWVQEAQSTMTKGHLKSSVHWWDKVATAARSMAERMEHAGLKVDLGMANGWRETPEIVLKCKELKHDTTDKDHGPPNRGLDHRVRCRKCNYVYGYDSSD